MGAWTRLLATSDEAAQSKLGWSPCIKPFNALLKVHKNWRTSWIQQRARSELRKPRIQRCSNSMLRFTMTSCWVIKMTWQIMLVLPTEAGYTQIDDATTIEEQV